VGTLEDLIAFCTERELLRNPATPAEIAAWQLRLGVALPAPIKAPLARTNGTEGLDADNVRFLSTAEIDTEAWEVNGRPEKVLLVAEVMDGEVMDGEAYFAYRLDGTILAGNQESHVVVDSLERVIEFVLNGEAQKGHGPVRHQRVCLEANRTSTEE